MKGVSVDIAAAETMQIKTDVAGSTSSIKRGSHDWIKGRSRIKCSGLSR